ncbi:unnamed protein product [Trifolium pratense]|uniref:Uncharacterized protein n=1 Tax=Trifolium pratense TaxID=57577 RepID=A0ACB0KD03_TRIPR|nr:unnamed protein product [Trifolium pratense]
MDYITSYKRRTYFEPMSSDGNREKKSMGEQEQSQGLEWDYLRSVVFILSTKKSHEIHSITKFIKIGRLLNTNGHFINDKKSQLNTNRFHCPEKKNHDCLN